MSSAKQQEEEEEEEGVEEEGVETPAGQKSDIVVRPHSLSRVPSRVLRLQIAILQNKFNEINGVIQKKRRNVSKPEKETANKFADLLNQIDIKQMEGENDYSAGTAKLFRTAMGSPSKQVPPLPILRFSNHKPANHTQRASRIH